MVQVFETSDGFRSLEKVWRVNEQNGKLRIFQTYDWCVNAWEKILSRDKKNSLFLLKWSQDGKDDVIIFPFYIDKDGTLRFILDIHNDNNDVVISDEDVNRHWVYREVSDVILKDSRIKSVWLQKMRGDSEALNQLAVCLPGALVAKDNAFAYIKVNETGDFAASQKHFRSENRKHVRKLLKQAEARDYELMRKDRGVAYPRVEICKLRDAMIANGDRAMGFVTDEMIDLAGAMYDLGACEIPVFRQDGQIISLEFRLLKGDYSLDWIYLSTDPRTGTEINVKYCVDRAKTQVGVIDFGVGAYEYKILTTRPMFGATYSLRMGKSAVGEFKMMMQIGLRMLKDCIKSRRKKS